MKCIPKCFSVYAQYNSSTVAPTCSRYTYNLHVPNSYLQIKLLPFFKRFGFGNKNSVRYRGIHERVREMSYQLSVTLYPLYTLRTNSWHDISQPLFVNSPVENKNRNAYTLFNFMCTLKNPQWIFMDGMYFKRILQTSLCGVKQKCLLFYFS